MESSQPLLFQCTDTHRLFCHLVLERGKQWENPCIRGTENVTGIPLGSTGNMEDINIDKEEFLRCGDESYGSNWIKGKMNNTPRNAEAQFLQAWWLW